MKNINRIILHYCFPINQPNIPSYNYKITKVIFFRNQIKPDTELFYITQSCIGHTDIYYFFQFLNNLSSKQIEIDVKIAYTKQQKRN